ncbi:hypothetical protein HK099_002879 [Clydaea vesicula]|uniref:Reverse transcriptase zinc-binding domain-containing protein n=1 Tax=Clydaea vesicula TaxID=447962 RepID=A0AAD5UC40_9FUNG|nr:hypothetical protein HK099_002879 [Clydaea vesicula]KAJ3397039.1 hypothetical protein HDU92_001052 [Lobulomyces angularis]
MSSTQSQISFSESEYSLNLANTTSHLSIGHNIPETIHETLSPEEHEFLDSKFTRTQYLNCNQQVINNAKKKWFTLLGETDFDILSLYAVSKARTTMESQIYLKLLHRRLPVNHYHKETKVCGTCKVSDETIRHAIFECKSSLEFWNKISQIIPTILNLNKEQKSFFQEVSLADVVYLFPKLRPLLNKDQLHVLNVIHSVALWTIWRSRTNNYYCNKMGIDLNWESFTMRLKVRVELEYQALLTAENLNAGSHSFTYDHPLTSAPMSFDSNSSSPTNLCNLSVISDLEGLLSKSFEFSPLEPSNFSFSLKYSSLEELSECSSGNSKELKSVNSEFSKRWTNNVTFEENGRLIFSIN